MSQDGNITKKTLYGMMWRFAERTGAQGISFIVSIILARILSPDDYGLVAMVTIFITISNVFIDSGLGVALIQKKDADDLDFSTVFYFNLVICTCLYLLLFFSAPLIARFYRESQLTNIIRVLSITILISSVKNIQQSYVSRHLLFRKFFFSTIGGTIVSAVIGIIMAYNGFGVWALVFQQLSNTLIDTVILWVTVRWRPTWAFSFQRWKSLFSYGWKLLLSSLLNTLYENLRQLIIGRVYSSADLAYYNRGKQLPQFVVANLNTSIDSVLLPVMSDSQDDVARVKVMTRRSIQTSSFILWPVMIGMAAVAEPMVRILLTDKWLFSVPYIRVFCIACAFQPIHTANLNAIKALGRSDIFLKLEIIKKVIGVTIIVFSMQYGVFAMAVSQLIYNVIAQIINTSPNRRLLSYGYIEQIKDIIPFILLSVLMGICVYPLKYIHVNYVLVLIIQIISGIIIYFVGAKLLNIDTLNYVLSTLKKIRENK